MEVNQAPDTRDGEVRGRAGARPEAAANLGRDIIDYNNKINIGQIAKSNSSWLIKSNYAKASNSLFNNFANNGKKPHHIASHSKCC